MTKLFCILKKPIAVVLLSIFITEAILPLSVLAQTSNSNPISDKLSEYVDPFTGDFSYNIPLLTITGPNGENYPIAANYSAGIGMNQESSWIGLGWDFNPGEINRNVKGFPDDWNGDISSVKELKTSGLETKNVFGYGPLYFNNFDYGNLDASMDVYQSSRLLKENHSFEHPDYDDYYVSGFGKMKPYIFQYGTLVNKNDFKEKNGDKFLNIRYTYDQARNTNSEHYKVINRAPEFRFTNELLGVKSPNPQASTITNAIYTPSQLITMGQNSFNYSLYNTNANLDAQTLPKGKQIFYFTNSYINNSIGDLREYSNFLNYFPVENGEPRPSTLFDGDGIGAFQVVDIDGKTYHYSLPVYTYENVNNSFVFSDLVFNPENYSTSQSKQTYRDNFNPYRYIDGTKEYTKTEKNNKYAKSWKLTAITGPDFVDVNQDGEANDGDKGYWITFNYGKWSNNFNWRSPYYGVYTTNMLNKYAPASIVNNYAKNSNYSNDVFREGSFSTGKEELYYLNSIETATQKAVFVKNIKKDGHSIPLTNEAPNSTNLVPKLRLEKIVLFDKSDINPYNFTSADVNSFLLGNSLQQYNPNSVIDVNDYATLESAYYLDAKSLKTIDFVYDYSLCKGYYNNSNQVCNIESITHAQNVNFGYKNFLGYPNNQFSEESGKLTLLEIKSKEQNAKQIYPSYLFNYDQNNPIKNPNFNPDQQDFWGYCKSDYHPFYRGHYTTYNSAQNTDVWSLKSIITPIGSEIKINYESDKYNTIGYDENESFIDPYNPLRVNKNLIQRTFQIYNVREGLTDNAKAYLLDNDAYYFMFSSSEDRYSKRELRLPIKTTLGVPYNFKCSSSDANLYDKADYNIAYSNSTTTKDGNYLQILQFDSKVCNGNTFIDFSNAIYNRSGFIVQYLNSTYGGGLRVKNISIKDIQQPTKYSLEYKYNKGVATSEPDYFASMNDYELRLSLNSLGTDRHIPNSNVGYSNVEVINLGELATLSENSDDYIGKTVFDFYNYTKGYSVEEKLNLTTTSDNCIAENRNIMRTLKSFISIKDDQTSTYGKIRSKSILDKNNNIIDVLKYTYKDIETTAQVFYMKYLYEWTHDVSYIHQCSNSRIEYDNFDDDITKAFVKKDVVSVLSTITHYNNGLIVEETNTEPNAYNVLTGRPDVVVVSDISKKTTELRSTPAYLESGNSGMGIKTIHSSSNKNLLSNKSKVTLSYKSLATNDLIVNNNPTTIINGSYTQWKNTVTVRKHNSITNQFQNYDNSSIVYFPYVVKEYNGNSIASNWDIKKEITLLDEYNRTLEVKDIRNRKFSNKYNSFGNGKLAECSNAGNSSFTFTSFEEAQWINGSLFFGGEVYGHSNNFRTEQTSQVKAHSGSYVCRIPTGTIDGPNYKTKVNSTDGLQAGRKYVAKIWVHNSSDPNARVFIHIKGKIGSTTYEDTKETKLSNSDNLTLGNWILLKVEINVPNNFTATQSDEFFNVGLANNIDGIDSFFDDLRVSPVDAVVTGYVINSFNKQIDYMINNDGIATRYEYDAAGRLLLTSMESKNGMKIISKNKYNFGR